jgi:hypothetical protein
MIHLFGDLYSPEAVGRLADAITGGLQEAILILPLALLVAAAFWMVLAMRTMKTAASRQHVPVINT